MTDLTTGLTELKAAARKAAFAARKEAFGRGQGQAAEILADFLAAHRCKPLAGYMAMRTEIDPLAAMAAHQGPVGVPVTNPIGCNVKWEGRDKHWMPPEACDLVR